MSGLLDSILGLSPVWIFVVVVALVFAEDAIFVGFAIPGETAAVLGGVAASTGRVDVVAMVLAVVAAAIVGDTVGYEVGRTLFDRVLRSPRLEKHRDRVEKGREMLRRRGGLAVLLGRFTAFFRAMMPALAGSARMPYRRFLAWNALGGALWGTGFVLLGYVAGASYKAVEDRVGNVVAVVLAVIVVALLVLWRVRRHRSRREDPESPRREG